MTEQLLAEWTAWASQPDPQVDREAARAGVELCYARAGRATPPIVFLGSPVSLQLAAYELFQPRLNRPHLPPPPARRQGPHPLLPAVQAELGRQLPDFPRKAWNYVVDDERHLTVHRATKEELYLFRAHGLNATYDQKTALEAWARPLGDTVRRLSWAWRTWCSAETWSYGLRPFDSHRLAIEAATWAAYQACAARDQPGRALLDLLVTRGGLCEMLLFHEVALVCGRPQVLALDAAGFPHNEVGPALAWSDGGEVFALDGAYVPREWIVGWQSLTAREVAAVSHPERRRWLIDQMGLATFVQGAAKKLIDRDRDAAGMPRRLFRVGLGAADEAVVVVEVKCPSTGKVSYLRVPPRTRRCSEAVAWTFGFTVPDLYTPQAES